MTLKELQQQVNSLIAEMGEDMPAAAWIFTADDVYVEDEGGDPEYSPIDVAASVLTEVQKYFNVYEMVADNIQYEMKQQGVIKYN
jgi:hypothetical protein